MKKEQPCCTLQHDDGALTTVCAMCHGKQLSTFWVHPRALCCERCELVAEVYVFEDPEQFRLEKPQWFLDLNPNGKLPFLLDGDVRLPGAPTATER